MNEIWYPVDCIICKEYSSTKDSLSKICDYCSECLVLGIINRPKEEIK